MATTVNIIIKGVAICYKKAQDDRRNFWRVLFPFDEEGCHKVNYSWRKGDDPDRDKTSLAIPRGLINIAVSANAAVPVPDESPNFTKYVFDLTDTTTNERKTHSEIRLKSDGEQEKWRDRTVLMKIEGPALFSVDSYMIDPTGARPILYKHENINDDRPVTQLPGTLAHTVRAVIEVPNEGKVTITSEGVNKEFSGGGDYTVTFDNDCAVERDGKNDMDMFYEKTIFDPSNDKRRFIVGQRSGDRFEASLGKNFVSIPVSLAAGKPCLVVKVTKTDPLV
ncbi:MAG TPA: hypothetical protein VGB00_19960 [Pyrinomonadaceae bacterium]|jgi:hypothetical protein